MPRIIEVILLIIYIIINDKHIRLGYVDIIIKLLILYINDYDRLLTSDFDFKVLRSGQL